MMDESDTITPKLYQDNTFRNSFNTLQKFFTEILLPLVSPSYRVS